MTREDIIRMAREAGIVAIHAEGATNWAEEVDALERFAALVAAAEREACAMVCDAASEPRRGYGQTDEQWAASTLAERIRARSQA